MKKIILIVATIAISSHAKSQNAYPYETGLNASIRPFSNQLIDREFMFESQSGYRYFDGEGSFIPAEISLSNTDKK